MKVARSRSGHRAWQPARRGRVVVPVTLVCAGGLHAALSASDPPTRVLTSPSAAATARPANGAHMSGLATASWIAPGHALPVMAGDARGPSDVRPRGLPSDSVGVGRPVGPIEADAYGLNLEFLATCLSCTSAQAGHNSSGAEARGSRLAGESISEGQIPANGYSSGSLVMLPANPLLRLVVAGWDGATTADGSSSEAHTRSALVDAAPGDGGLAALTLADSRSEASARGASSHASGESNIAHAALGGGRIAVVTLHSEGSSDRAGRACIASVNGWEVMPSSRGNRITVLPVAEMAALHGDSTGAVVGSVSDGRSQRIVGVATTWVGDPPSDPQPMR